MTSGIDSVAGDADHNQAREKATLARGQEQMDRLRQEHPEYFAYLEDVNPMLASRPELLDLMDSAPNDAVYMYLYANFSMRLAIASITGREFS